MVPPRFGLWLMGRYEEAVETGQVKDECTAEWKGFQSLSR
jgi:hypothetical protein